MQGSVTSPDIGNCAWTVPAREEPSQDDNPEDQRSQLRKKLGVTSIASAMAGNGMVEKQGRNGQKTRWRPEKAPRGKGAKDQPAVELAG